MSNAVQFLESLGRSPCPLSDEELVIAVANLDESERNVLVRRDVAGLSRLLGGRASMVCSVMPAEDEEPLEEEEQDGESEARVQVSLRAA